MNSPSPPRKSFSGKWLVFAILLALAAAQFSGIIWRVATHGP